MRNWTQLLLTCKQTTTALIYCKQATTETLINHACLQHQDKPWNLCNCAYRSMQQTGPTHAYWLHAGRVGIGDMQTWSMLYAETLLYRTAFKPTYLMILNVVSQPSTYGQDPFAGCCWFLLRTQDSAASKFLNWAFWPLMTACCATVLLGVGWGIAVAFSVK